MSILIRRRTIYNLFLQTIRQTPSSNNNLKCLMTLTRKLPQSPLITRNFPNLEIYRTKSKASKKKEKAAAAEESDEEEFQEESADFDSLIVDKNTKIITTKVNSLRTDVILKSGLSMARNKVEEMFYESKLRVNGKKILKKSDLVDVGDEIDIIKSLGVNPNFLIVARVEVLDVKPKNEGYAVRLRRCKSLTIDNYEEPWKPGD